MTRTADQLRSIKNFDQLIPFLEEDLEWPFPHGRAQYDFEDPTFQYSAEEVGLEAEYAAKIKSIHQLRPLVSGQPWGIFFVEFENKKLPIVVLRRILSHLVLKKRKSANPAERARWNAGDLIFISAFAEEGTLQREIAFAHFHQDPGDQPTLRVLGWDGGDTPLKLEHVAQILKQRLSWPNDTSNHELWRKQWAGAFRYRIGQQIQTADLLAKELARVARNIRDAAIALMRVESSRGPLRKMHEAFRVALIHDLDQNGFADTYAQTITYGLLTAAISRTDRSAGADGTFVLAEDIHNMVPITNPFLKEMLESFLKVGGRNTTRNTGLDFDELGVQDVVELLRSSDINLPAVLEDFGNRNPGEDPVIRFYEDFLKAYNRELRIKRGVFYTPQPVVSFIVRSVHELLQTDLGIEDGLASTITWGEMISKHAGLVIPSGSKATSPFVVILDPATGTATFLVEVIDVIHKTLVAKWKLQRLSPAGQEAAWNDYVPKHLLPRLYGYELLMAPYAIAHMKIGLKLYETGYNFGSDERARIYLTNALEPATDDKNQREFEEWVPALAHEARDVNEVKRLRSFTVVIGNPPYSKASQNLGEQYLNLIERFRMFCGERIREPGAILFERDINNDYVKFFGLNRNSIERTRIGVLGMITSSSYLDGKNFRGVRDALAETFNGISVLNLHGDSRSGALARQGVIDENVFEIETGVSVILAAKTFSSLGFGNIAYSEVIGSYGQKAALLLGGAPLFSGHPWLLDPRRYKSFVPSKSSMLGEYSSFKRLDEVYRIGVDGIKTSRDGLVIANTAGECASKIEAFMRFSGNAEDLEQAFGISVANWDYKSAQRYLRRNYSDKRIFKLAYRPFDFRYIYYDPELVFSHREEKMSHLIRGDNLALVCASRLSAEGFNHILPADCLVEMKYASHDTNSRVFPVRLYGDSLLSRTAQTNDGKAVPEVAGPSNNQADLMELSQAILAILNSSRYRLRDLEEIKNDFPRIPQLSNSELRRDLAAFAQRLINAQLLKTATPESSFSFGGKIGELIDTPKLLGDRLYVSPSAYFLGADREIFDFNLAGYQICKNWVSAGNRSGIQRKGTIVTRETVKSYRQVLFGIQETIKVRAMIDNLVGEHFGW